jgi:ABC-type lipoprotein export system ATPase subunit
MIPSECDLGTSSNPRGSEWHRWDPHIHAPGTVLNDQFSGDWHAYLSRIEDSSPTIEALGITDYFSIRTYRTVLEQKLKGRLPNVMLIFPNIEMRLDIKTGKRKPINIHLLFSPDDPNHAEEIERVLGFLEFDFRERTYKCAEADLMNLGRAFDPRQVNDHGALRVGVNQFKTTLRDLRNLFRREEWLRKNCLVAVAGGLGDGTSGLQEDDSYAATRREIERFAKIIFSSTPGTRDFWLGKKPNADRAVIERTYGCLKPCLHGSDAHEDERIGAPDLNRYCWIKGDLTFEGLRQVVIEPEERVWLGPAPPKYAMVSSCIREVHPISAPWLQNDVIELNTGLVAIVGSRGSGKTALVDVIASGGGAIGPDLDDSSFLKRAVDLLDDAAVQLVWGDGSSIECPLISSMSRAPHERHYPDVCYLSQHFVEQLCSSAGLATALRREMERVVFNTTDPTERMEADSFEELAAFLLQPIHSRRESLQQGIRDATAAAVRELILLDRLPQLKKDCFDLTKQIDKDRQELALLIPKEKEAHVKRLTEMEQVYSQVQGKIESWRRRSKRLDDLIGEVAHLRSSTEPARLADMRHRFQDLQIAGANWAAFEMKFSGDVDAFLTKEKTAAESTISLLYHGRSTGPFDATTTPLPEWPLKILRDARDVARKDVGIDSENQKKYDELQRAISQKENALRRLSAEIENAEGAPPRRQEYLAVRQAGYKGVFGTLVEEQQVLEGLYAALRYDLAAATGALTKLKFIVERHVDLDEWANAGERLLDLRKGSAFQGHGALKQIAERLLLRGWERGTPEEVAAAMAGFLERYYEELLKARPTAPGDPEYRQWSQLVGSWLYETSHIRVQYGIEYDGVAIEQLSPGTRGIVLLLLYLAIDRQDLRPLIVDQPEENLDPRSVFLELVPHFREARKRRQVIIVTHNANLVVNTDADQVIVATSSTATDDSLPNISYKSGSLENADIRRTVCDILEGGERAFLERERRYRLHWDDATSPPEID